MTIPPNDELERALWTAGIECTPEQLEVIRKMVDYAAGFTSDAIGATISVLKGGPRLVQNPGGTISDHTCCLVKEADR